MNVIVILASSNALQNVSVSQIILTITNDILSVFQCPFKKAKGLVQRVLFHPTRPFLFVAVSSKEVRGVNDRFILHVFCFPKEEM